MFDDQAIAQNELRFNSIDDPSARLAEQIARNPMCVPTVIVGGYVAEGK